MCVCVCRGGEGGCPGDKKRCKIHRRDYVHVAKKHQGGLCPVPRFAGKTQITRKTAKIPERPKNNRESLIGDY